MNNYRRTKKSTSSVAKEFFNLNISPRTPWETKAAEACNRLEYLDYFQPGEMLREISEILEQKVEKLTEADVCYKDISYVCYVLAELALERELEGDCRVGPYDKYYLHGTFYTPRGARSFILQFND